MEKQKNSLKLFNRMYIMRRTGVCYPFSPCIHSFFTAAGALNIAINKFISCLLPLNPGKISDSPGFFCNEPKILSVGKFGVYQYRNVEKNIKNSRAQFELGRKEI